MPFNATITSDCPWVTLVDADIPGRLSPADGFVDFMGVTRGIITFEPNRDITLL
jgi:hypothetical protein